MGARRLRIRRAALAPNAAGSNFRVRLHLGAPAPRNG
jgi:hypothetical protein